MIQDKVNNLRHSAAHLLAAAVEQLYPDALRTIGPAIDTGFYFDFDNLKISDEDLPAIEAKMHDLAPTWKEFSGREVSVAEAKDIFKHNPYKLELIDEFALEGQTLTIYRSGEYEDLCRGGHCPHPSSDLKHFKLLSVAGAYWRGSEKNKMLTRIYGTIFPTKAELEAYIAHLEDARARDHKKLGKELDLFVFSETVGKGLPLWTPKGATIRRQLESFVVDEELKRGYLHVYTPDIASLKLYQKSGHYPYYKDSMYAPIEIDDEQFMLRPMTCPHHFELYLSKKHSYKELPMRIAELAQLYRYEKSGELMGLQRVRTFCLADAHIIARKEQAKTEINQVLDLIEFIAGTFGLQKGQNYSYRLSLGDRSDDKKYFKDDASWEFAENVLRTVLQERESPFVEAAGEAAFYGPKIDIQMRNVNGKEDTAFTVQYDFVMPQRFNLTYINEAGHEEQAIVIHRSSIGAIERVMALLIEHFAGAFPTWLSPVQVAVLPISDKHTDYASSVVADLKAKGVRVELNDKNEPLNARIRDAGNERVPYILVVGDRELESASVSVRRRGQTASTTEVFTDFASNLAEEIAQRRLN